MGSCQGGSSRDGERGTDSAGKGCIILILGGAIYSMKFLW